MSQSDDDLQKLTGYLGTSVGRKKFAADPERALGDAGVSPGNLPEGVFETLSDLSHDELRALVRVRDGLQGAGVSADVAQRIV